MRQENLAKLRPVAFLLEKLAGENDPSAFAKEKKSEIFHTLVQCIFFIEIWRF